MQDFDCVYRTQRNGAAIHWTAVDETATSISFALEVEAKDEDNNKGWVGLSVQKSPGKMYPAWGVIGLSSSDIKVYDLNRYDVTGADVDSEAEKRVSKTSLTNNGTHSRLQFTREVVSGDGIDVSQGGMTHFGYAYARHAVLVEHNVRGSVSISLRTGVGELVRHPAQGKYVVHAYLNLLAWCYLLPTGVLTLMFIKRRRQQAPAKAIAPDRSADERERKTKGVMLHYAANTTGVILGGAAIVYAVVNFHDKVEFKSNTHSILGVTAAVVAASNAISGFIRPKPSASSRATWFTLHKHGGRLIVVALVGNIVLGLDKYSHKLNGYQHPSFLCSAEGMGIMAIVFGFLALVTSFVLVRFFIKTKAKKNPRVEMSPLA